MPHSIRLYKAHLSCIAMPPSLPSASAIMIDIERETGVIQLETKAYSRPAIEAFGFEVGYGSELYNSLRDGYLRLIADGRRLI